MPGMLRHNLLMVDMGSGQFCDEGQVEHSGMLCVLHIWRIAVVVGTVRSTLLTGGSCVHCSTTLPGVPQRALYRMHPLISGMSRHRSARRENGEHAPEVLLLSSLQACCKEQPIMLGMAEHMTLMSFKLSSSDCLKDVQSGLVGSV